MGFPGTNGQFHSPVGIEADSSGNVYVVDPGNFHVQKFDSNGKFITALGTSGVGNGQFSQPTSAAADLSVMYVVDRYDNCTKI